MIEKMHQRYLTIEEMLSFSWDFFKLNFRIFLIFAFVVGTPVYALQSLLELSSRSFSMSFSPDSESSDVLGLFATFFFQIVTPFLAWILALIALYIAYLGLSYKIERGIAGVQISISDSLRYGLGRFLPVFGTVIFELLALVLLFMLLVIPGIIFLVFWVFTEQSVVLRRRSLMGALNYSKSLVNGRWWHVLGISLFIWLASMVASFALELLGGLAPGNYVLAYIVSIATFLKTLFFLVIGIVFFLNLDYLTYPTIPQAATPEGIVTSLAPDDPLSTTPDIMNDDAWGKPDTDTPRS